MYRSIVKIYKIIIHSYFFHFQALGIPTILKEKNTLLAAETGCGKTLAYLTPLIQKILAHKQKVKSNNQLNSPLALVIVPGRELADQIGVCFVNTYFVFVKIFKIQLIIIIYDRSLPSGLPNIQN